MLHHLPLNDLISTTHNSYWTFYVCTSTPDTSQNVTVNNTIESLTTQTQLFVITCGWRLFLLFFPRKAPALFVIYNKRQYLSQFFSSMKLKKSLRNYSPHLRERGCSKPSQFIHWVFRLDMQDPKQNPISEIKWQLFFNNSCVIILCINMCVSHWK